MAERSFQAVFEDKSYAAKAELDRWTEGKMAAIAMVVDNSGIRVI